MMDVDLAIFMGQSNMAGRGEAAEAAQCDSRAGFEFRAVSDPGRLYPIREPFGVSENRSEGIDDGARKTGSMVSAFAGRYFEKTERPLVAVSASVGGTTSGRWAMSLVQDAAQRLKLARGFLDAQGIRMAHIFMVWCQGESDGDNGVSGQAYRDNFFHIYTKMQAQGVEKCACIQIGHFNYLKYPDGIRGLEGKGLDLQYGVIRDEQEAICRESRDILLAASFSDYLTAMKDPFHYCQGAYNEVGFQAADAFARVWNQD